MEGSRSRSRSRRNQTTITDRNNNSTPVVGGVRPQSPYLIRNGSRSKSNSRGGGGGGGGGATLTSNIISSSAPPPPAEVPPLTPPIHSSTRNSSTATKATISGSNSTTKSRRISKGEENTSTNNLVGILSQRYEFHMNYADPIIKERKLKSNNTNNSVPPITKPARSRSATNSPSPSAWALSPGRTPSPMTRSLDKVIGSGSNGGGGGGGGAKVKSSGGGATEKVKSGGGGGISVVLKYFRSNKKVSSIQEEAFHRYRVLHTRLVQWRLVNARAEVAILNRNSVAEKKLFNVWLRTYQLRNSVIEKRMQVQKLKNEIKLLRVINPELRLLNEWTKIEKRNSEAVAKLSRNLMASSFRLPLIKGAKAETVSMYRVMFTALNVMNDIEETMKRSFFEAEEKVLLVNELKETIRLETEGLEELRKTVSMVAALEAQEKSLRVYVIQTAKEGFRIRRKITCSNDIENKVRAKATNENSSTNRRL